MRTRAFVSVLIKRCRAACVLEHDILEAAISLLAPRTGRQNAQAALGGSPVCPSREGVAEAVLWLVDRHLRQGVEDLRTGRLVEEEHVRHDTHGDSRPGTKFRTGRHVRLGQR